MPACLQSACDCLPLRRPTATAAHPPQACLSTKAKPGAKAALKVRVAEEGEALLVCCLREGGAESVGLDLIFDQ